MCGGMSVGHSFTRRDLLCVGACREGYNILFPSLQLYFGGLSWRCADTQLGYAPLTCVYMKLGCVRRWVVGVWCWYV